jgi:hypothetical protein
MPGTHGDADERRLAVRSIGWVRRRLCNLAALSDHNGNASACMTEHLN